MADNKVATRKQTGPLTQQPLLSNTSRIVMALAEMAIKRGGEMSETSLKVYSGALSKEPFEDVIQVIGKISDSPRREHEAACPDFGTLLLKVRDLRHPHRHLREIVTKLARIFGASVDEELLMLYQEECGHRTDEDLDVAYKALRGDESLKKMPTPSQLRAACGIPKVYRDGRKPE